MGDLRILVIDDHPLMRNGVAAVLGAQPGVAVVGEAGSGSEALEQVKLLAPDLCLVDLRMPGMSGADFIRAAQAIRPSLKFIVLTTYDGDEDIHAALSSGADAYVLKGMAGEDLVTALRTVAAGGRYVPAAIRRRLSERMGGPGLTPRETEILHLMAEGRSNKEIGEALHITEGTVKWNVNHILSKLSVKDRTQAVTAALRRGIIHFGDQGK
jgi:two-component system, NarL family, response regulator